MSKEKLRESAARWHEALKRNPVSADTQAAFSRWMEESAEHRNAYSAASKVWSLARGAADDPRMLALRHEAALQITRRSARRVQRVGWLAASAAGLLVGAMLIAGIGPQVSPRINAALAALGITADGTYRTRVGERLVVNLADGSQLTLNTNSVVEVAFTAKQRLVRLRRGQALFEVAKDAARAFIVEAGGRRLVAVGTSFDVRIDGERVQVTMLEGVVRVERTPQAQRQAAAGASSAAAGVGSQVIATLSAGEQLTVSDRRRDRIQPADPDRATSWRRGQLLFENTRLADALGEVNRYSDTQLELADESLADLRISGAFATGRPFVFVEALTAYFPIDVDSDDEQRLILSRRESALSP